MRIAVCTILSTLVLLAACAASAQTSEVSADTGVPIAQLIESVAKQTGKKFVVDPQVRASVTLIGHDISNVSYPEFVAILGVHGFIAFEKDGLVRVVPDANARQFALAIVPDGKDHLDAEFVTAVMPVRNTPAAHLVPILRPLIPRAGHFAAMPCSNVLIMSDTYGNVKRIEALVKEIDVGTPYQPEKCSTFVYQTPASKDGAQKDAPPTDSATKETPRGR